MMSSKSALNLRNMFRLRCLVRHASTAPDNTVGFIGLGNMGFNMASNLIKKGNSLVIYDIQSAATQPLEKLGAKVVSSPAEVASNARRIVTMLPASPHVRSCYAGDNGIFVTAEKGTILMDSSTIDPESAKTIASLAREKGLKFLDTPVSGGVGAAKAGTLTFMVGGTQSDFNEIEPILSHMGAKSMLCGSVGSGQIAKICNNMLLGISMIGTSETMNLGIRLGLDPKVLASIVNSSSGRCWSSEVYNPVPGVLPNVPASNDYVGGFGTALMTKDLGLAMNAAVNSETPTPLGSMALSIFRTMCANNYKNKDFSSVFKFLSEETNDQ